MRRTGKRNQSSGGPRARRQLALALLLLVAGAVDHRPAHAQPSSPDEIAITGLNDQPAGDGLSVGPAMRSVVTGQMVVTIDTAREVTTVTLVVHRIYDGRWSIAGTASVTASRSTDARTPRRWTIRDVALDGPELGKGFELYAAGVDRDALGAPGAVIDYETMRRAARVISKPLRVHVAMDGASVIDLAPSCFVELRDVQDVNGARLSSRGRGAGAPLDVSANVQVDGEVDAPAGASAYLVVRPISGGDVRYVMPANGARAGRRWTDTATLGRPDLNHEQTFRMQGVVSRRPIVAGAYGPAEWAAIEQEVCASSAEVLVRRVVEPSDLLIESIDDAAAAGRTVGVTSMFQIDGTVIDKSPINALAPAETVWILSRRDDVDESWTVQNLAIVNRNRFDFRAPGIRLAPGRHRLIAIASLKRLARGDTISDLQWYQLVRTRTVRRLSRAAAVDVTRPASPTRNQ